MIELNPSASFEMAIDLYKSEQVSMSRAAEIAGMSIEGFKRQLESRGIKRIVHAPPEERMRKGVDFLLRQRNP